MYKIIAAIVAGLIPMTPAIVYYFRQRHNAPESAARKLVSGLKRINLVVGLMIGCLSLLWLAFPQAAVAAGLTQTTTTDPYASLAAAIAAGVATISAGIAVSNTGSAAVGAIAEKPETFGRALVFVGLAEGIGIYGLIVAVLILNR